MLLETLVQLAVGRVVLAWLPPGWPGYGRGWELGATLSASWMLGALAWGLAPLGWLWALVFGARLATLPGALRPRHGHLRRADSIHAAVFAVALGLHLALPVVGAVGERLLISAAWMGTGRHAWRLTADRRARALGVAGLLCLVAFFLPPLLPA
ncbi:MAG: hypothetical protein H6828_13075 [Planctomycetes bacterium]|nr:hypothetical protein [Planctomycetota bacterium]